MSSLPCGLLEVWDYLACTAPPPGSTDHEVSEAGPADAIVCLGSTNLGTARRAAALYAGNAAPVVVASGGAPWRDVTHATEADAFASELTRLGVPSGAVVPERHATNTGENARFAVAALEAIGVSTRRLVVVCFPTLTRRAVATFDLHFSGISVRAVPSFDALADFEESPQRAVALVVAEVRRLVTYPRRGLIAPVEVPDWVVETAAGLARAGTPEAPAGSSGDPGPSTDPTVGDFPYPRSANCVGGA